MLSGKEQAMNNYEQMCEALVYARTVLAKWARDTPFGAWNEIGEAIDKCDAALSAPPRQCDMGTAKEQSERFRNFCKIESSASGGHCTGCRAICYGRDKCEFIWAQMSYDIGGAK